MHLVIVEDELLIQTRLKRQITQILGDKIDKLKTFDQLDDAQSYLSEQSIDLLFLDLNLRGQNGFELLKTLTAASFHTIIVSAHCDKAIEAFEYGVLDFVAKPFTQERLAQAINRLLDINQRQDFGVRYLSIKQNSIINLIQVSDIDYISAAGHYSEVFIKKNSSLHDKPIEKLLAILPPNFLRIHRSYVVNSNKVKCITSEVGSKYTLELHCGKQLPIGRTRVEAIKEKLS